jgi:hypothetical protein
MKLVLCLRGWSIEHSFAIKPFSLLNVARKRLSAYDV